jgi:hypothetical protein
MAIRTDASFAWFLIFHSCFVHAGGLAKSNALRANSQQQFGERATWRSGAKAGGEAPKRFPEVSKGRGVLGRSCVLRDSACRAESQRVPCFFSSGWGKTVAGAPYPATGGHGSKRGSAGVAALHTMSPQNTTSLANL